ncbi:hypothetical protein, partial [uncultured Jannaschia sp.]|uniref:hypothetical protein n=1 Tax=uncultured Jannaschia sp. TaxID=293347 RepID=UPI002608FBA1
LPGGCRRRSGGLTHPEITPPSIFHHLRDTTDWSAGEMLNYAKWSLMAVVFVLTWRVTGLRLYMALAFFVLLVLADDALQLHERGSEILMTAFPALRADSGSGTEIVIWVMIGLLGLSAVGLSLGGAPRSELAKVRMAGVLFVPIIFFGVVVDAVHAMAEDYGQILLLVEDGGEMLAISVLAAYVYASFRPGTDSAIRWPFRKARRA